MPVCYAVRVTTRRPNADKTNPAASRAVGDPCREAKRARVEQALRQLPLDESDVAAVAAELTASAIVLEPGRRLIPDSRFFDFRQRVLGVVGHFGRRG